MKNKLIFRKLKWSNIKMSATTSGTSEPKEVGTPNGAAVVGFYVGLESPMTTKLVGSSEGDAEKRSAVLVKWAEDNGLTFTKMYSGPSASGGTFSGVFMGEKLYSISRGPAPFFKQVPEIMDKVTTAYTKVLSLIKANKELFKDQTDTQPEFLVDY